MAELIEIGEQQERVILFAASTNDSDDTEESVEELKELVKTAGAETVGTVIQNRENIHPGTYLGKGKIQELKEMVWETGATGVVCDDELSPAQLKNLEDALDTKVMDRTMIILDIFAARAKTRERSRSSWHSSDTVPSVLSDSEILCRDSAAESARGGLVRRNSR
mgnify:CR=1 FL=1